jgi:hypothetical protein
MANNRTRKRSRPTAPQKGARKIWGAKHLKGVRVVVFVPVVVPWPMGFRNSKEIESWKEALTQFSEIPDDVFTSDVDLLISETEVVRLSDDESRDFRRWNKIAFVAGYEPRWPVLVISVAATVKFRELSLTNKTTKVEAQALLDELAVAEFGRLVKRWIIASLLAKPGILSFWDLLITREAKILIARESGSLGFFGTHLETAQAMNWPVMHNPSIEIVWRWLQKIPEFNSDFGLSKVGIAVAAFTHLLGRREVPAAGEGLLWALLGLEALYTTGNTELSSQLVTKTQLFLGEQRTFKKAISQMYHYRSRFVHGDIRIPMRYCHYDNTEWYRSYAKDIDRHTEIATNVLISTLQTLAERNWTSLSFAYKTVEPCRNEETLEN